MSVDIIRINTGGPIEAEQYTSVGTFFVIKHSDLCQEKDNFRIFTNVSLRGIGKLEALVVDVSSEKLIDAGEYGLIPTDIKGKYTQPADEESEEFHKLLHMSEKELEHLKTPEFRPLPSVFLVDGFPGRDYPAYFFVTRKIKEVAIQHMYASRGRFFAGAVVGFLKGLGVPVDKYAEEYCFQNI
jgi:hypothetical protein